MKAKCDYGCNNNATFTLKNGKKCCSYSQNKCKAVREKNSHGLKKAYVENRRPPTVAMFGDSIGWARGRTANNDPRIRANYTKNIFCISDKKIIGQVLKRRMLNEGWVYKCNVCGINDWMNKSLTLQVDHINGNNKDNRKENLQLICPNCHSQTSTFCRGTRVPGSIRVSDELLLEAYNKTNNITEALLSVGVTNGPGNRERLKKLLKPK
jgi:5-methylcytosine-specific restriction endonuclease McrA